MNKKIFFFFILILIFLLCLISPRYESFSDLKCIENKSYNAADLAECSADANLITKEINQQAGLANNADFDQFPNKQDIIYNMGSQHFRKDIKSQPKCLCNDELRCLYLPTCSGSYVNSCGKDIDKKYVLKKVCKVNDTIDNKLSGRDCSGSSLILKTPKVKGNFQGWFYLPSKNLDKVEADTENL